MSDKTGPKKPFSIHSFEIAAKSQITKRNGFMSFGIFGAIFIMELQKVCLVLKNDKYTHAHLCLLRVARAVGAVVSECDDQLFDRWQT